MTRRIRDCLLFLTHPAVVLCAQSHITGLKIHIHIYNYAGLSRETLARTEHEGARIFQRIGIETEWLDCPLNEEQLSRNSTCDLPGAPSRFTLRLLSNTMAERFPMGHEFFGFALLPVTGDFGVMANVFAERAQEMGGGAESMAVILGDLIVHELGHLLLGSAGHSVAGIMRGQWQTRELHRVMQGRLSFLPEQASIIRAQVTARMIRGGEMP